MLVNIAQHFIEQGRTWLVGESVDVPTEVAQRWVADGKATADADGRRDQSSVSGDGTLRRRPMIGANVNVQSAYGTNVTAGTTVTQAASAHPYGPRAVTFEVQTSGASARPFASRSITWLETGAYYALVVDVLDVVRQPGSLWGHWFGMQQTPTEASITLTLGGYLNIATHPPAIGRMGYVFKASSANATIRFGIGCETFATVTAGDRLVIGGIGVYRVDGLASELPPFAYSPIGPVGYDPVPMPRHAGSCILAVGDSWSNDTADWPGLLSTLHFREVIQSATGGHSLAQMRSSLMTALADQNRLYLPNRNAPGMMWLCGGINDRITLNRTAPQIIADAQAIIDIAQERGMRVGIVIQTDATNCIHYTAAKAEIWKRWADWVKASGLPFVDSREIFQNADGTANAYMVNESGALIHPSYAGHVELARAIDAEQRRVDMAGAVGAGLWVA